ncbi:MAG: putative sulfate exporter family transporter [Chloroflexi bacterium]|nr:putative sulfate exporter family transporter [Chloroflexota bacterium]
MAKAQSLDSRSAVSAPEVPPVNRGVIALGISLALVVALAIAANRLTVLGNLPFGRQVLEYPLFAAGVGLVIGLLLTTTRLRSKVDGGFRTEFFLKTGLVLMGATINFGAILSLGAKGIMQALLLVTGVFFFTWWVASKFHLDEKLRALIATSVAICGVSAAIAAAGSVVAKRQHLTYVVTLVILFALPLMVLQPYLARLLGLPSDVAGAWIGGNIDTTAAVVGAGAVHSPEAMKVASIVKLSQNTLIGFAAFLLALYWVTTREKGQEVASREKPRLVEIWERFPKFVLGFVAASLIATFGLLNATQLNALKNIQTWFLTAAFVSIGLQFTWTELRGMGSRPVAVYAIATLFNTVVALGIAYLIFGVLFR